MKNQIYSLFVGLALLAGVPQASAQATAFFRISGPAATKITAFRPDGRMVWTNALSGTNYTVQTLSSLPGAINWVDYVQLPVTNGMNTNWMVDPNPPAGMSLIPAGSFQMGDNLDGESDAPVHSVYVSAFYMDQTDVTEALWQQVYNWATNRGYSFAAPGSVYAGYRTGPNYPVYLVDWYDCAKWCNARSEFEGRTPAYYTGGTQTTVYRTGQIDLSNESVNWDSGFRLPTEAEWEKAARGGLSGLRFPWGDTISWQQANHFGDPLSLDRTNGYAYDLATAIGYDPAFSGGDSGVYPYTSPVNYFAPSGYGLYDMAGNVWQWCWDSYGPYGSGSDPRGPSSSSGRVIRGGSWCGDAFSCRTADRGDGFPANFYGDDYLGFRPVLAAGPRAKPD